jgi:hypothetical protein
MLAEYVDVYSPLLYTPNPPHPQVVSIATTAQAKMKLWKETFRSSKTTTSSRVSGNPQLAACEGHVYLRFFSALCFIVRTIWTSQTYDVIDYYFPFNTILSTVWWCPCYVTAVYVNNWSWHVHGSHAVCLLKPGVTDANLKTLTLNTNWKTKIFEIGGGAVLLL